MKPTCCITSVWLISNRHTTSTRRRIHVDITSIRPRLTSDEFPWHFYVLFQCNFADRKICVISTYFFHCYIEGPKIHVVSTSFFQRNFDGRKIRIVSTYLFRCNFVGQKIQVVCKYFFRRNSDRQKFDVAFG